MKLISLKQYYNDQVLFIVEEQLLDLQDVLTLEKELED